MKKIFFCFCLFLMAVPAMAQETDCPFGYVNERAPGSCGLYTDKNGNFICDLSELPAASAESASGRSPLLSENELKRLSVRGMAEYFRVSPSAFSAELSKFLKAKVSESDSMGDLHDRLGLCTGVAAQIAGNLDAGYGTETAVPPPNTRPPYLFLPISLAVIILYGSTYILALQKKITIITHRRIWNIILTLVFLVSGSLGLLLVLRINYGWLADYHLQMLKLHVNFGIAMAIITFFHIAWHWPYYRNLVKRGRQASVTASEQESRRPAR